MKMRSPGLALVIGIVCCVGLGAVFAFAQDLPLEKVKKIVASVNGGPITARFCMAAAWRSPRDRDLDQVCEMVSAVKGLGMETCVTLGMLTAQQAQRLREASPDVIAIDVPAGTYDIYCDVPAVPREREPTSRAPCQRGSPRTGGDPGPMGSLARSPALASN